MKITLPIAALLVTGLAAFGIVKKNQMSSTDNSASEWPPEVIERVEKDRIARDEVYQRYPELFAKISAAMFRYDPIDINYETNTDEYDAEAGTVIPRLKGCTSSEDVVRVVHEEFSKWFGLESAGKVSDYAALAEEIFALWTAENSPSAGDCDPS